MGTRIKLYVALWLVGFHVLIIAMGCGGQEMPAGESATDRSRTLEDRERPSTTPKGDEYERGDDVGHGFDGAVDDEVIEEEDDGDAGVDAGVDGDDTKLDDELRPCAMLCETMERCYGLPGAMSLIECRIGCEVSRYDGSVMDRDVRCFERAQSCGEVRDCVEDLRGCDDPCDAATGCEIFDDGTQCRDWCGPQVVSGMTTSSQIGCMETEARHGRCGDMGASCHLDGFPNS